MNNFKDDVDVLLNAAIDTFGELVKYYPVSGGVQEIRGVFDQNYFPVDPDTEVVISDNQPVLGVNLNELSFHPSISDKVEIDKVMFRVVDVREDGQGGAMLFIQRLNEQKKTNKRAYSRFS